LDLASGGDVPKLFFEYDWYFDSLACEDIFPKGIPDTWIREVAVRTPELEKGWEGSGTNLMNLTVKLVEKPFRRKEETASYTLCPDKTGSASPLILNVSYYLQIATKGRPWSTENFVSYVFHEMLHRYIGWSFYDRSTPLLERYKNEDEIVWWHLHLVALAKAVYLNAGEAAVYDEMLSFEASEGAMKRAWEIINDPNGPGYQAFIDELRAAEELGM